MRSFILTGLLATFASGCYFSPGPSPGGPSSDGTITVENGSSYVLAEVRVTQVASSSWGPNLLGDVLYPNERLTIAVACGTYDVLVSDDYARDCVLGAIDLCFADELWVITNATLRNCSF
jgi:hypothetical protein